MGTMPPVVFTRFDHDTGEPVYDERFTVDEASEMLHVSRSTIYNKIKSGEWPGFVLALAQRNVYLSKADINEIHELTHQDGVRAQLVDPDPPVELGTVVNGELDETGPIG